MSYILAADTGGTFTDLAAYDTDRGRIIYTKALTTYNDLVEGVMECLHKAGIELDRAEVVKFGTTLVINTFIQRNGAKTALVTTEGFRDILEVGRGNRPIPFDFRYKRNPPLVERDLRFTVPERIAANGEILKPLDVAALSALAERLRAIDIEAVAISFLTSYLEPRHEDAAAVFLRKALPGVYVTASTELTREWYEYERTATAVANAYVGPRLKDYVRRLDTKLREEGLSRSFYLMASNGGVFSVERAEQQPVMLVESGPVGGCIGTAVYADALGLPKAIAFDMGGTTAKCAVIENGHFDVKSPYYIGGNERGFPVRGAVLDIVEVGAGGGSIAWLDEQERLNVGPRSAGSAPGPVCYGRGGTEPTITDANLVLGRIGATSFLGGEMRLDEAAARGAIEARVAMPLGFSGAAGFDETAEGILALGTMTMAGAIRQVTIERGLDPRDFTLFAFGGGGPLHASQIARELNIPQVIIPPEPGIFSALGMILADARVDETRTFLRDLAPESLPDIEAAFRSMEETMRGQLESELASPRISFERQADMRFHGQRHTLRTPLGAARDVDAFRRAFEASYERKYGHVETNAPIEFVGLILTAYARIERPKLEGLRPFVEVSPDGHVATRPVHFGDAGRIDTPVLHRNRLSIGYRAAGPAVIEEYGSTTIVGPNDSFEIGSLGEIRIACGEVHDGPR
jgi:N-methylhydantoinase A